jgi:hypothetical protein
LSQTPRGCKSAGCVEFLTDPLAAVRSRAYCASEGWWQR